MKIIVLKELLKKRWIYVLVVGVVVILTTFLLLDKYFQKLIFGAKLENFFERIWAKDDIFNLESYYAEYDLTVIGNKTINTYFVKEWYRKDNKYKFEYVDKIGNIFLVTISDGELHIKNLNEINEYHISYYNNFNVNICSVSYIIQMYNEIKTNQKLIHSCKCTEYKKDKHMYIHIETGQGYDQDCVFCKVAKEQNISKIILELDSNNIPIMYTVYDTNKNEKYCIMYTKFEINLDLNDEMFIGRK